MRASFLLFAAVVGCGPGTSPPPDPGGTARIAVLSSDYSSTALSLIDPASVTVARGACVSSGSRAPALTLPLSGDVVLPSQSGAGEVTVIDRTNATLTFVGARDCEVRRQFSVGTGFRANPHDVARVGDELFVTRFERNPSPRAGVEFDEGDDLLILDAASGEPTGRIDLGPFSGSPGLQARPDRVVVAGSVLAVTLQRLSPDFVSAIGPGAVALVDPGSRQVSVVEIPGRTNCGQLAYDAGSRELHVACSGFFAGGSQASESGLAVIDLSGAPAVLRQVEGTAFGGQPVNGAALALAGEQIFVVTHGDFSDDSPPDVAWTLGPDASTPVATVTASGAGELGRPAYDPSSRTLFLPDGSQTSPVLRVLQVDGPVTSRPSLAPSDTGLPPRDALLVLLSDG